MCFIEKRNCIRIRKREGLVLDLVRTSGWVLGHELLTQVNKEYETRDQHMTKYICLVKL